MNSMRCWNRRIVDFNMGKSIARDCFISGHVAKGAESDKKKKSMNARPTNVRWRVLLALAFTSFVAYVLRGNISLAAPDLIEDLSITPVQLGYILAAFLFGYSIFQFPGGILGDKFGARKVLAIIAVLWTVTMVLTVVVPGADIASVAVTVGALVAVRFLAGAVQAPIFPVMNVAISRWFPVGGWGFPTGLTSTGLTLGFAAAAPVMAWLLAEYGWRIAFLAISPLGVVSAGLWWWYSRDNPADHPAVNAAEVELITAERLPIVLTPVNPPGWVRVLTNRNIILLTLSYTCSNFVFYEVFNWFHYYLIEVRQFDAQTAAFVTSSQWIAGAVGAALGGWLCDALCRSHGIRIGCRWPIIIGLLGCALLLAGGALQENPALAAAMLALCFFFQQITEGAFWSSSIAIGNQLAGAAGGVMNTGANAVGVLGAMMIPWFAEWFGWTFAIGSGAIFAALGGILLLFVRVDEPIRLD